MPGRKYHIIFFFVLWPLFSAGQNTLGLPEVVNYIKSSYNAGLQNWDISQDKNGIIYFANNEGLLSFDGNYWTLFPLPNKTIVRSVETGTDNRIYVGGQDELGYFMASDNGTLAYHSLTDRIPPASRSFGDVWDIAIVNKDVFFRTSNRIFRFVEDRVAVYAAKSEWSYMGLCRDVLYAHDYKAGIMAFRNNIWAPVDMPSDLPLNDPVTSILPAENNTAVITTLKNGLFRFDTSGIRKIQSETSPRLQQSRIYGATSIDEKWIALATNTEGVLITDTEGRIIQHISKTEQLQNNNVLSIFLDNQQNLWLGLDNGIDFIAYNSPIKHINPMLQDESGYTAAIFRNRFYMGTSNGLYQVPLQPLKDLSFSMGTFAKVKGTQGQVWNLSEVNNRLLMGHHDGAFLVQDTGVKILSDIPGFWNFIPLSNTYPSPKLVSGHYKGLVFFDDRDGQIRLSGQVPGFTESSRFVEIDAEKQIWVSHPYHGIYRIGQKSDSSYDIHMYTDKNGLPSSLNNHIYTVRNEILAATENGIYVYNRRKDKFEPSSYYRKYFGTQSIRYLKEDPMGNIWFIHQKNLGVLDYSEKEPKLIYLPDVNNKMLSGFETIYPVDSNNVFLCGEKGFFHINYAKYRQTIPELCVQIRNVRTIGNKDSIIYGGYAGITGTDNAKNRREVPAISYSSRAIHFEYSCAIFGQQSKLEYSYRLKGFDDSWSEWTKKTEKEYTNLPSGYYSFDVKVRNNLGNESPVASFAFKILPPWYQTSLAIVCYILLVLLLFYFLYQWQRKKFRKQQIRFEEEQNKIMYIHELELNKTESELVALRNEKLETEISYKNAELVSSAMHLVKKGELLAKVKDELSQLMKRIGDEQAIAELKKMIKTLSVDENIDKEWENFTRHFDAVNSDFVLKLKESYPNISSNELKLCAYLRMNLSTKEISQLMNISVRGVEISRYRLRKKLGIPTEVSLFDFLIRIRS